MGLIAKVLSFTRSEAGAAKVSDVKMNPGGGANITGQHFSAPGDDSVPLAGDYLATSKAKRTGSESVVGYIDPNNDQKASSGEKRIYARDADGNLIVEFWLKNDGSAVLENEKGSVTLGADGSIEGKNDSGGFELQTGGNFVVNNVTITPAGEITTPQKLTALDVTASITNVTLSTHLTPAFNVPPTAGT